jgi:hypothetical protein
MRRYLLGVPVLVWSLACAGLGSSAPVPLDPVRHPLTTTPGVGKSLRIAPDLSTAAHLSAVDGGMKLTVGQETKGTYRSVVAPPSLAGSHWALGVETDAGWRVVVDGTEGAVFTKIGPPRVGPDGTVAYVALTERVQET